ncbi:MAG: flagellar protein [bacterium]
MSDIPRISPSPSPALNSPRTAIGIKSGEKKSFQERLNEAKNQLAPTLRLSAHAQERLQERSIYLTPEEWRRVEKAVENISQSGGQKALVMMENLALIVGVPQRTIITVVPTLRNGDLQTFTSIDSAVLA